MERLQMVESPGKSNLYGLDRQALERYLARWQVPAYHASQIYRWLYARRRFDIQSWTDLPGSLRQRLAVEAYVDPGRLAERVEAADGTIKYRTDLASGGQVESVYMVQSQRVTLCLSSQVGCALDCDFCLTGRMGFVRHLSAGEIVGQVALIQDDRRLAEQRFNLVFMGMGEPLHNYDAVIAAIHLLVDPDGFGLSRRRITVSTSGLAPAIERLASEPIRPRLAVSLNATTDAVRQRIMPINRKYPLARLLAACRTFSTLTGERFTFEYVLLQGVNDSAEDMSRLARIVRSHDAKLNLIPFNPVPGWLSYRPPSGEQVRQVRDRLLELGAPASIRFSRGRQARAACGQLALLPRVPPAGAERQPAAERSCEA